MKLLIGLIYARSMLFNNNIAKIWNKIAPIIISRMKVYLTDHTWRWRNRFQPCLFTFFIFRKFINILIPQLSCVVFNAESYLLLQLGTQRQGMFLRLYQRIRAKKKQITPITKMSSILHNSVKQLFSHTWNRFMSLIKYLPKNSGYEQENEN
jgi:hypothetical protein